MRLVYLTDRPRQAQRLQPEQRDWLASELEREASLKQARRMSVAAALGNRDVWFLCLAYLGGTTGDYGLSLWLPKILQRIGGLTDVKTTLLTAVPSMAAIPAMLLVGWNSDRVGERRWHAAIPPVIGGAALAAFAIRSLGAPSYRFSQ